MVGEMQLAKSSWQKAAGNRQYLEFEVKFEVKV
jgi:hypothetical protein